jgi:hypothetical protein
MQLPANIRQPFVYQRRRLMLMPMLMLIAMLVNPSLAQAYAY